MNFLKTLFKSPSKKSFLGEWYSDITDEKTFSEMGDVKMIFSKDGKLTYKTKNGDTLQTIFMTYHIKHNTLITNQPSHPQEETTEFMFLNDEMLILKFNGEESRFISFR